MICFEGQANVFWTSQLTKRQSSLDMAWLSQVYEAVQPVQRPGGRKKCSRPAAAGCEREVGNASSTGKREAKPSDVTFSEWNHQGCFQILPLSSLKGSSCQLRCPHPFVLDVPLHFYEILEKDTIGDHALCCSYQIFGSCENSCADHCMMLLRDLYTVYT